MATAKSKPVAVEESTALVITYPPSTELTLKLDKASSELVRLGDEAIAKAGQVVIRSDKDVMAATDFVGTIKTYTDRVEAGRKELGDPLRKVVDAINGKLMPVTKRLQEAEAIVKGKIRDYNLELQRKAQAEAERIRKEEEEKRRLFEEEQEKKRKLAEAQGKKPAPVQEYVPEPVTMPAVTSPTTFVGKSGASSGMRDNWVHRVVDVEKIPRQYLMPNDAMIKAAIKTGTRQIPGLEIYNEPIVSVKRG